MSALPISSRQLEAGESLILQSNGTDTHYVMGGVSITTTAKNIVWVLRDTDANTTGDKILDWEVPFDCTITGWKLANPNNVATTTAVDVKRATDSGYPATFSTLNPSPLGVSAAVKASGGAGDFSTTALSAGDSLRLSIATADAVLTDLRFVLGVSQP